MEAHCAWPLSLGPVSSIAQLSPMAQLSPLMSAMGGQSAGTAVMSVTVLMVEVRCLLLNVGKVQRPQLCAVSVS